MGYSHIGWISKAGRAKEWQYPLDIPDQLISGLSPQWTWRFITVEHLLLVEEDTRQSVWGGGQLGQRKSGSWALRNYSQPPKCRSDLPMRSHNHCLVSRESKLYLWFQKSSLLLLQRTFWSEINNGMFPFSCLESYLEKREASEQGFMVMWWMIKGFSPTCNGPEKAAVIHATLITANRSWVWHPEVNMPLALNFPLWTNWHWGNLCHK